MGEWEHGLFGCFDNLSVCVVTYFFPCYTAGKNAQSVGEDCLLHGIYSLIPFLGCYMHYKIRGEIREKKGIPDEGGCAKVVCVYTYCCAVCSYCQEAQEMDSFHASMAVEGAAMDRQ